MRIRGNGLVRVVVLVLTVSLTLVLLPIAINVGTGGIAPAFLAPYADWTWPVIGLLWVTAIVTGLLEIRSRRTTEQLARSADQPRNRPNALDRVERYLEARFAGSLASRTRLALDLDERPEAVVHPYDLLVRPLNGVDTQVRQGADIATMFDDLQDSMLILGAPGAGKTTLLLDLARSLTEQARNDSERPIPVLVDLAGWAGPGASKARRPEDDDPADSAQLAGFIRWLLGELSTRYQIPAAVGRVWLRNGRRPAAGRSGRGRHQPPGSAGSGARGVAAEVPGQSVGRHLPDPGLRAAPPTAQPVWRCPHPAAGPPAGAGLLRSRRAGTGRSAGRDRAGRGPLGPGGLAADAQRDGARLPGSRGR